MSSNMEAPALSGSYAELRADALCPLCGSTFSAFRRVLGAYYYFCPNCSIYYLWPVPSKAFFEKYYSIFHRNYGAEGCSYADWSGRLTKDFAAKRRVLEKHARAGKAEVRILDYGCAYGQFLAALAPKRYERFGYDLSAEAIAAAAVLLGSGARLITDENQLESLANSLDCVTLWATIEHLPAPAETLKAIHRLLRPDGVLILDTGLTNDVLARSIPGNVQWFDAPQHLWVFTKEGMSQLLQASGFAIEFFDGDFERSALRRVLKRTWKLLLPPALAALNGVMSLEDRKIPVGNLGLWVARKL